MESADVQAQIRVLETLRAQTRFWRWGVMAALFAIVAICLFTLWNSVHSLTNDGPTKDQFVRDLSARLQQNALPSIEQMGSQALHEIDFAAEAKKLNRRTPELTRASRQQVKLFASELPQRGQKVLNATFGAALKQRESKIRSMFPEATDEQIAGLMTNLTAQAQEQAADVNDQLFAQHKKALDSIVHDFDVIQTTGAAEARGQQPTWDMALLIFDLARNDLKSLAPNDAGHENSKSQAKGTKK